VSASLRPLSVCPQSIPITALPVVALRKPRRLPGLFCCWLFQWPVRVRGRDVRRAVAAAPASTRLRWLSIICLWAETWWIAVPATPAILAGIQFDWHLRDWSSTVHNALWCSTNFGLTLCPKKMKPLVFLNNSVKHWPILIVLACNIRKKLDVNSNNFAHLLNTVVTLPCECCSRSLAVICNYEFILGSTCVIGGVVAGGMEGSIKFRKFLNFYFVGKFLSCVGEV